MTGALALAPAPRRPLRKSDRTRRRIITAARHLFERRGYRDTTIDDITRRAQVAHGTFYLYFRGKADLLNELLQQALEEFDQIAASQPAAEADIADLVRLSLETYQRNRLPMRLLREASVTDSHFREHYDELFIGRLVEHLRETIEHIQAVQPQGVEKLDPKSCARAIVGLIESFAYGIFLGGEDYPMEVVVETLSRFCSRAVGLA
jgi:AcrR family transcriptional regulator